MMSYFGDEYPGAITLEGVRIPLAAERRWTRTYATEDRKIWHLVSRFMDGSASITYPEFAREWPTWSAPERHDFRSACSWMGGQGDFSDILRYIMQHGGPDDLSAIATSVGTCLPQEEAFALLTRALHSTELGNACNIAQGISLTRHPDAAGVLRAHLAALWSHPLLWDNDEFINWFAYGATRCIEHLIAIGSPPQNFIEQVRKLATHPCVGNRDSCHHSLAKHFPWIITPTDATGNI